MRRIWPKSNGWLALLIIALVSTAGVIGYLAPLDNSVYASGMRFSAQRDPSPRLVVVDVNAAAASSPNQLNQVLTRLTDRLNGAGADVIGFVLSPDQLAAAGDFGKAASSTAGLPPPGKAKQTFLASIAANHNVVLAATVSGTSDPVRNAEGHFKLPASITLNRLPRMHEIPKAAGSLARFRSVKPRHVQLNLPPAPLAAVAAGVGVLADSSTLSGAAPAVLNVGDAYMPGFAVEVAARALNLNNLDITRGETRSVLLGTRDLPSDRRGQIYPYFHDGGMAAFPVYPADDVLEDDLPPQTFHNKIVLIGVTSPEAVSGQQTPLPDLMPPVIYQANVISSIMQGDLYAQPVWFAWLVAGLLLLLVLYVVGLIPRLRHTTAVAISVVLALLMLNAELILIMGRSLWLPLVTPILALLLTHVVLGFKRFLDIRIERFQTDLSETNRLLGKSYQQQGQLDLAMERYKHCLPSAKLAAAYYELGLGYESQRRFAKATSSFQAVQAIEPDYLDVERRLNRLEDIEDRVVRGGTATQPVEGLMAGSEGLAKPMLGRYSIEEELGRGSMGVVYLGRDPRIGRTVAIKTMSLGDEAHNEGVSTFARRFFREAKAAGRLSHPNIVTIYDVGEDRGVAYIAMDYLGGENLKCYCHADRRLDFGEIMRIGARVADALSYAHENQVIHRDVKPGNVNFDPETGRVKVMDFGVAFVTDGTGTRSTEVLGSPSYMSPEQVRGKTLDGRSDIFSLGVTLFQLAAGDLPFKGQPITTLMYRIATEPHTAIHSVNPDVPSCLARVIDKALQKSPADRWQSGTDMARELRLCLSRWRKSKSAHASSTQDRARAGG